MKSILNRAKANLKQKKGFTLIEIIVVLVILAILAAAAIPSLLGFIEDSRGKAYIAEARAAFVACQAIITEEMASGTTAARLAECLTTNSNTPTTTAPTSTTADYLRIGYKIYKLLHPDITLIDTTNMEKYAKITLGDTPDTFSASAIDNGALVKLIYTKKLNEKRTAYITLQPPKAAIIEFK